MRDVRSSACSASADAVKAGNVVSGNTLRGDAKKDFVPGSAITVTLKTAVGKSGQAKFKN